MNDPSAATDTRKKQYRQYRARHARWGGGPVMERDLFDVTMDLWDKTYLAAWRQEGGPDYRTIKRLEAKLCVCRRTENGKNAPDG